MAKKKEGAWVQAWCENCQEYRTVYVVKGKAKCPKCEKDIT